MVYVQDALYTHLFETYLDLYLPFQGAVPLPAKFLRVKENHDRLGCKPSGNLAEQWGDVYCTHYVKFLAIHMVLSLEMLFSLELSLKPTLLSIHTNCKNEMYEKTPTERFIEVCT